MEEARLRLMPRSFSATSPIVMPRSFSATSPIDLPARARLAFQGYAAAERRPVKPLDAPGDDESWKAVPLKDAIPEVGHYVLGLLAESDLTTVGALADWCATKRLTDVLVIGDANADKIEEALAGFWARRNAEFPDDSPTSAEALAAEAFEDPDGGEADADTEDDDAIEFDDEEDTA